MFTFFKIFVQKKTFRSSLCALLLFLTSFSAFSLDGALHGSRNLKVLRTEYFDIIYPDDSRESAEKIARVADAYYLEITARLGIEMHTRFPVTITKEVESFNAYFTVYPYNIIVLYDTWVSQEVDSDELILENTFYHELTHAITGNIKRGFIKGLSSLFGDWVSPTFFASNAFWNEGTAVYFESRDGSGRLNDPYNMQTVLQAKIEGSFPSWREVTGARDLYPSGRIPYMFGSLFGQYLSETYGEEQYTAWWRRLGYGKRKVPEDDVMRALSGKNMKQTWEAFKEWLPVPQVVTDFTEKNGLADFFEKAGMSKRTKNGFSKLNNGRRVYGAMDTSKAGVVWYERKTGGVWFAPYLGEASVKDDSARNESVNGGTAPASSYGKPRKLLCASGVSRLSLSEDGSYVAVSYLKAQENTKSRLAILSTKNGAVTVLPFESVADAAFVTAKNSLNLLTVDFSDGYTLKEYELSKNGVLSKKNVSLLRTIRFNPGEVPFSPVDCGSGRIACIVKNGLSWKIRLYDADGTFRDYGTSKTIVHNLHARLLQNGTIAFSFSYVEMGRVGAMLARGGLLYVSPWDYVSELVLQSDDISGGILDMAFLPDGAVRGREQCLYLAGFYETSRLVMIDFSKRKALHHEGNAPRPYRFTASTAAGGAAIAPGTAAADPGVRDQPVTAASVPSVTDSSSLPFKELSYNPLRYYKNGALLPIASVSPYQSDFTATSDNLFGFSWLASNPWRDHLVMLSGGYQFYEKYGLALASLSGGNDIFSYSLSAQGAFNGDGFVQTVENLSLERILYSQFGSSLSLGASGSYFYGKGMQYLTYKDVKGKEQEDLFYDSEDSDASLANLYVLYSTIHKRLPGYFQYGGIAFKPFMIAEHTHKDYVNAGATLTLRTPWLFPLTASASLYPTQKYFATATLSAILCSFEIQRAIPALYFKRIYLRSSYTAHLSYDCDEYFDIQRTDEIARNLTKDDYSDAVQLYLGLHSALNWGFLSYLTIDGGAFVLFRPNPEEGKKKISYGITAQLVY